MKVCSLLGVCSLIAFGPILSAREQAPTVRWEPFETMGVDDQPIIGQLGRIQVPEDRSFEGGPEIELAFVRFKCTAEDPGPPFVYLAGGPGGPGIEGCLGPATGRFVRLLQYGDVIGLDQRGTGRSLPNLSEGPGTTAQLPYDRAIDKADFVGAFQGVIAEHVAYWRDQGVELHSYNTEESADDIEDLRRALGYEAIILWGSSYGSHLALAYLRRRPEHVARAVITKVEGPDHTVKLPSTAQRHLEKLHERVAADPQLSEKMPDLSGTVAELLEQLLEQLEEQPVSFILRAGREDERSVTFGPFDL